VIAVTYIDHCGTDISVVNAARVSFGKESEPVEWQYIDLGKVNGDLVAVLNEKDQKLIHYLAKHEHYSPFGHCFASFHVKAPLFVRSQLVKHKFLRVNEISRRYVDSPPEFYVPDVWRGRSKDKKQGSDADVSVDVTWYDRDDGYNSWPEDAYFIALEAYQKMLELGVAPEQARMVLPQSTMTEWYWSGSLDAFADMCNLRLKPDAQYETRLVAEQISDVMRKIWPISWEALMK
jgi:thymidylate synthase (FAD)